MRKETKKTKQNHKERYVNLKSFEIRKATAKIRLSSHKLSILTGKWCKTDATQ